MKLAISNIAWQRHEDNQVFELMTDYGFSGLEVAPTRLWDDPLMVDDTTINTFCKNLAARNISVVSLQALHYGYPELTIFQSSSIRAKTLEHTKKCIVLAKKLGAKALVFGSPQNRRVGDMDPVEVEAISIDFFRQLGAFAFDNDTVLCIEPNPVEYNADFITRTEEAVILVEKVNHPGFKLNIDTGTIFLNGEDCREVLARSLPFAGHFHISNPMLSKITDDLENAHHQLVSEILRSLRYKGWLSIEMKPDQGKSNIDIVEGALRFVTKIYT